MTKKPGRVFQRDQPRPKMLAALASNLVADGRINLSESKLIENVVQIFYELKLSHYHYPSGEGALAVHRETAPNCITCALIKNTERR